MARLQYEIAKLDRLNAKNRATAGNGSKKVKLGKPGKNAAKSPADELAVLKWKIYNASDLLEFNRKSLSSLSDALDKMEEDDPNYEKIEKQIERIEDRMSELYIEKSNLQIELLNKELGKKGK